MLPLIWLAISPAFLRPFDTIQAEKQRKWELETLKELRLSLRTLLSHEEPVDIHIVTRKHDFPLFNFSVPFLSKVTLHDMPVEYVLATFLRAGVDGGAHHSGIGGACKLLLPNILNMSTFLFFDTDTIFLRPVSVIESFVSNMQSHQIIAAGEIKGLGNSLGFKTRINSGVMIFKNVSTHAWENAVVGALLLNPFNCDQIHGGLFQRPICIKHNTKVLGDQEVISFIVSSTNSLFPLPDYIHHHYQGSISEVPEKLVILHYKRYPDAIIVAEKKLGLKLESSSNLLA